jgi:dTDP-4-dehydrorhamnose reductase
LSVVDDEIGGPTSAADFAEALLRLVSIHGSGAEIPWGVYHCSNRGFVSRFGLAERIVRRVTESVGAEGVARLKPVSTSSRSVQVKRPAYSVLDAARIQRQFGIRLRHWTDAVDDVVDSLLQGTSVESWS